MDEFMQEDVMLPEGWHEGEDLFENGPTDTMLAISGDGPVPTTGQEDRSGDGRAGMEEVPTKVNGSKGAEEDGPDHTEPRETARPNTLKFRARVDRQDRDVELDERELPTIYQKAQVTDRVQAKLARMSPLMEQGEALSRRLGYDGLAAMLARAEQGLAARQAREEAPAAGPAAAPQRAAATMGRDYRREVCSLLEARPDLKGTTLPDSVYQACVKGKSLLAAYTDYEVGRERSAADRLRRENAILRQNTAAAARAPIRGARGGGGADTEGEDDFLRGFHFDD